MRIDLKHTKEPKYSDLVVPSSIGPGSTMRGKIFAGNKSGDVGI